MRFLLGFLLCLFALNLQAADYSDTTVVVDANGIAHGTGYIKSLRKLTKVHESLRSTDLPVSFDLRAMGDVSPIKDQGQCGSCWAHATTESLEDAILFAGNPGMQLSAQQMTGCNSAQFGCDGGEMNAADYLVTPGLALDKDFPYQGSDACKKNLKTAAQAKSWAYIGKDDNTAPTTDEIKAALVTHGSVFVTVAAGGSDWNGQAEMTDCSGTGVDHMVEIVGWNTKGEWIMRNSWGTGWGDAGFAYMPFGCDEIATDPDSAAYTVF